MLHFWDIYFFNALIFLILASGSACREDEVAVYHSTGKKAIAVDTNEEKLETRSKKEGIPPIPEDKVFALQILF